jgi:hypothetical protein
MYKLGIMIHFLKKITMCYYFNVLVQFFFCFLKCQFNYLNEDINYNIYVYVYRTYDNYYMSHVITTTAHVLVH